MPSKEEFDRETLQKLEAEKQKLERWRRMSIGAFHTWLTLSLALLVIGPFGPLLSSSLSQLKIVPADLLVPCGIVFWAVAWLLAFLFLIFALQERAKAGWRESEMQDVEFQIDIQQYPVSARETRAEKTLLLHNNQLRRYYDQNLWENSKMFWVGVLCIFFGAAILGGTIYAVFNLPESSDPKNQNKIILAVLGAVGSLLTNYVAAIYLKMHGAASRNLGQFHSRLVDTNHMYFSNVCASRIHEDQLYEKTLSQIAMNISKSHGHEPKESSSSQSDIHESSSGKEDDAKTKE